MKNRLKHKLAWHLRKWAQWLDPQPLVRADRPLQYRGKEYEINPLRLELNIDSRYYGTSPNRYNHEFLEDEYKRGADAISMAVKHLIEIEDSTDKVVLQLLTLKRKKHDTNH